MGEIVHFRSFSYMHVHVGNVIHIMCTLGYAVALLHGALNAALSECTAAGVSSQRPPEETESRATKNPSGVPGSLYPGVEMLTCNERTSIP